jgi:hypothetical protein
MGVIDINNPPLIHSDLIFHIAGRGPDRQPTTGTRGSCWALCCDVTYRGKETEAYEGSGQSSSCQSIHVFHHFSAFKFVMPY